MNNHSKKSRFIFLSLLFAFSIVNAQNNRINFNYITNINGLTNNTVYDICQDNKGFTWFATPIGLNRFDGQNIKQYYHNPNDPHSLPTSNVVGLTYTRDSSLFISTTTALVKYIPETDDFKKILSDSTIFPLNALAMSEGFKGELMIAGGKKGGYVYNYLQNKLMRFDTDKPIFSVTIDHQNTYWICSRYTAFRFARDGKLIKKFVVTSKLFQSAISHITTDKNGKVWVGTFEHGLYTFNPQTDTFEQLPICKKTKMYYVRTLEQSETPGEYWVGTESGLYIINTIKNEFIHYKQSFDHKNKTINDNAVYKIYRNKLGVFFIGTYFGGVNVASKKNIGFNAVLPEDKSGCLHGKAISTIARANDGNLWLATEDAGIAILDKNNFTFRHLFFDEKDPNSISSNNVHALLMDENFCWAGFFMGGISKIDIRTEKARRFLQQPGNPTSLNNNFVFALENLSPDTILVGTHSGVDLFDKKTEIFSRFRENEFTDSHILDIFTAPDGKIWFCTSNKGIFVYDKNKKGLMTHFQMGDKFGLNSNTIISYCIDSEKHIWIGTRNGGLLKYKADKQEFVLCKPSMLNDNIIYGIVEDQNKYLWVSTNKGISRLNFADSTSIHFNTKHGLAGNQHNYESYYYDNGIIYFGGVTGFTWFNPETISIPREKPTVYFTNLRIFNEIIYPNSGILTRQIDFTKELTLKYNQNSFTFDFSSINYFNNDIVYQYYLEGFDRVWSPWTNLTQANYTNVIPGDYIFHIRAMNTINNLISEERTMKITVKPPFWAAWYAYLFYSLLIFLIGYYSYRNYLNRQREQMALAIEKIEKENLKLLHQHKMNFFTYISHEFKTPLSIIIASIDMLSQKDNMKENSIYESIKRSSTSLLKLVNQLMEFRKIETDHAVIQITKGNVIDFTHQVIDTYRPLLKKKNIEFNVNVSYSEMEIFFDFDKLEKIMTNLLTNAIKYTPVNEKIEFSLNVFNKLLQFSVKDSGAGISDKKKDKIFEVFYSDTFSNDVVESSGIGLALTASLVKLLSGKISVESKPGHGSKFNVSIPYFDSESPLTPVLTTESETGLSHIEPDDNEDIRLNESDDDEREFRLVIAEDNKDLLMLLTKNFEKKYYVKYFENGQDAWDYINIKIPDIVITDVMMPIMDGVELCQKIKMNVDLCHIQVVMLTAKDSKEAKLEGLQAGADAYIAKPFSMAELEIRLTNIINNQKALKNRLKELAGIEGFDIPVTNHEQAFVEKMLAIIQNNMERNELDVQFIANELNISRSNLHNKMKLLMNMTTSEFVNTVRINKAKELINEDKLTFSEIAYKVGYNDSAYFTRIFKKHTNKTPGEYRQMVKKIV